MSRMNAVRVYESGGPEKLIFEQVEKPAVKPGWSLVRVRGFGINHSEIFTRKGLSPSVKWPRILGIECVGEIAETDETAPFPVGTTVVSIMGEMGRAFDGSYAEFVLLPNEQIYPVRTKLPWAELAALPETFYTAFGSMENLRVAEGERVLVRAATSGVGLAFCKLLRAGTKEISLCASCRDLKKAGALKAHGFDAVIEDRGGRLQTAESFDKVLELVGPATLRDSFAHVNAGGTVCSTGQLGGVWALDGFDPITELPRNGYLTSFYSGNVDGSKLQKMLDYVAEHQIEARPERIYGLDQVPAAHEYLESADSFGKVVVLV